MIAQTQTILRLLNFAIAIWILGAILWGIVAGKHRIDTPLIAVWLFLGVAVVRFIIWVISKALRR